MKLQSLFLYTLAAVLAMLLANWQSCADHRTVEKVPQAADTVRIETHHYQTVEKIILRPVTIRDTVHATRFVLKDTTLIFFADGDTIPYPDSMRVYEGFAQSENCEYQYLTGIWNDSIQFLDIKTACETVDPVVIIAEAPKAEWGFTAAWSPFRPRSLPGLGLHARKKQVYLGAEYFPTEKTALLRAGIFLPLKK